MDQNTALVLGGLIVVALAIVLMMGRGRIRKGRVDLGGIGGVDVDSGSGPIADKNRQEGSGHKISVHGNESAASRNLQKGDSHEINVGP